MHVEKCKYSLCKDKCMKVRERGVIRLMVLRLCMIGFGNAGMEFCRLILQKQNELIDIYDYKLLVTDIVTKSKGMLRNNNGIDLERALGEVSSTGRFSSDNPDIFEGDSIANIMSSCSDAVLEMSTLSIKDGQPAIRHIEAALASGKHVITANKGPIAWAYKRLKAEADSKGLQLLYETTVMDGTPVFNLVKETLPGCRVLGFKGILNSTTNFILEEMEAGRSFEEALKEAQLRGFAEAEPSMDIDGWDAAAKTAAIVNAIMGGELNPFSVERKGISGITLEEIQTARKAGKKIKLLCEGWQDNGLIRGLVAPTLFDDKDIYANIDSTSSIISIQTDLMGEICIVERKPEIQQTAYGIYSDTLTLIKRIKEKGKQH